MMLGGAVAQIGIQGFSEEGGEKRAGKLRLSKFKPQISRAPRVSQKGDSTMKGRQKKGKGGTQGGGEHGGQLHLQEGLKRGERNRVVPKKEAQKLFKGRQGRRQKGKN